MSNISYRIRVVQMGWIMLLQMPISTTRRQVLAPILEVIHWTPVKMSQSKFRTIIQVDPRCSTNTWIVRDHSTRTSCRGRSPMATLTVEESSSNLRTRWSQAAAVATPTSPNNITCNTRVKTVDIRTTDSQAATTTRANQWPSSSTSTPTAAAKLWTASSHKTNKWTTRATCNSRTTLSNSKTNR